MTNDAVRRVVAGVKFNVLGPLTVTEGTATLNIGGPKQRTVLAMLVSRAGSPVSADLLVDAVYGDEAGPRSRRTIQTFVSTLRGEVGDVIQKAGGGWRFTADRETIDAEAFEDLVAAAKELVEDSPDRAAQLLRDALALWTGHPYSEVEAHGHLDGEVSRLNELRLSAQSSRIDADLASGRHGDLVGEIEALLVEHPYQEHFRAQHMLALYRAGRQQEALASFRQMRGLLADELGIDPSTELQDLELRILEQDASLQETAGSTIQRKAVLVADPGDPLEIARLDSSGRETVVARAAEVVEAAVGAQPGAISHSAGTATYALFDDTAHAASAAETVALRLDGEGLRMAIDWGDVEVGEDGVTGPPVTRAARLVGVAHRGQILLSAEAQQALSAGGGPGLRFETLGSHALPGLENSTAIFQLLVGDAPAMFSGLATDRLPPPLPGAGHRSVPGYELREPFGRGSIGELYTAYQPSVGRQVLVEVIPRSIASDTGFIRRFEADVQRLWLLDHPNINSIVDYWRDPEGAFVVYRWHRGGLLDIGAPVAESGALVTQIGSALAYAHSYGLVHGSLAPDRVLLDESGNAYLLGFPIASVPGPAGAYPEFIAPETVDGSPPSVGSDVYALGMLALELDQGGRVPADSPVFTNVPALSRALSDEVLDRYPSVADFLGDLAPGIADSPDTRFTETRNPYKGLAAFHESDAQDFFGRSELTGQLVERLAEQNFLAVVGPSGSGKSSVVRAGLIPAVRQGRITGSDTWLVTDMLPGSHPFLELRRALERVAVDMPPGVMDALATERPDALADIGAVLPDGASLLLLVDQFEELFTLVGEETRSRFIALLSTAVADGHARVVVTLRADFLDKPLAYSELAELFDRRMVTVGAPTESELREAISSPAGAVGVEIGPDLVERMVHEVHDRPGALPLLQHTLSELFGSRESDLIAIDTYESVGGVSGSLGNRAESTYQDLDDDRRTATKQMFLRLVTITDESAPTRRRIRVSSLEDLHADAAVAAFISVRLLVVDTDPDTRTPTVEVAHEALLTHWPRLSGWIESAREDLTLSRRLEEAMQEWQRNDHDDAYLLTGARLAQHRTWTSSSSLKLTDEENEYLELSKQRDQKQRAQRRRRRNWITGGFAAAAMVASVFGVFALKNAEQAGEAAQLAKARELAASSIGVLDTDPELATLLAVEALESAPLGIELFPEALIALREAVDANRLAGRIEATAAGDVAFTPDGSGLVVVESGSRSVTRHEVEEGQVGGEVWKFEDLTTDDRFQDVTIHPDGDVVAVSILNEPFGGEPGELVEYVEEGDDGKRGRVILLDLATGDLIQELDLGECVEVDFAAFYFSWDGSLLGVPLYGSDAARPDCNPGPDWYGFAFYDTSSWEQVHRFDFAWVSITEDMSQILVSGTGGRPAELFTFPELELVNTYDIDLGSGGIRFISPDGSTIVYRTGNEIDFRPGFWDVETDSFIGYGDSFSGFFLPSTEPTFTPTGTMLANGTESDILYDVTTGAKLLELPTGPTNNAAISPDGALAVTAHHGQVLVWHIGERAGGRSLEQDEAGIFWLNSDTIDVSGPRTMFLGFDGDTRTAHPETGEEFQFFYLQVADVDPESGEVLAARQAHTFAQLSDGRVAYVPVEVGDPDDAYDDIFGPLKVWDPSTGDETVVQDCQVPTMDFIQPIGGTAFAPSSLCPDGSAFAGISLAASPDGALLAAISPAPDVVDPESNDRYVIQIWDLDGMELVRTLDGQTPETIHNEQYMLQHFGDGWLAVFSGVGGFEMPTAVLILDAMTGEPIAELQEQARYRESFEVSPDGSLLYLIGVSGEVFEYDTATWERVRTWAALDGHPRGLAVSPDGRQLGVGGENEVVMIWDLEPSDPELVDRIPIGGWISDMTWIDDDRMGVGVVSRPPLRAEWHVIDLDADAVARTARSSLFRDFTSDECRTYSIERCDPAAT